MCVNTVRKGTHHLQGRPVGWVSVLIINAVMVRVWSRLLLNLSCCLTFYLLYHFCIYLFPEIV